MQALKIAATDVLRPDRLNYAGWCIYCGEHNCAKAGCVKRHAESFWGPCSVCGGSQLLDVETDHLCNICIGGLTQYDSQEEAFEADRRETEARNRVRRLSLVRNPEYVVTEPSRWRPASDSGTRGVAPLTVRTPSGQVCYGGH